MLLQLDEEALRAEDVEVAAHEGVGFGHVAGPNGAGDVGGHAAGGADEAIAVGGQGVEVDARPVVEAVELGGAGELEQVEVAGLVLGQQQQVGALAVELRIAVGHAAGGDVGLDADDGLDVMLFAGLVEGHDAEHDAVVGQGQGGLVEGLGALGQVVEPAEAVEQGVLAVDVEMDEGLMFRYRCRQYGDGHGGEYNTPVRIGGLLWLKELGVLRWLPQSQSLSLSQSRIDYDCDSDSDCDWAAAALGRVFGGDRSRLTLTS